MTDLTTMTMFTTEFDRLRAVYTAQGKFKRMGFGERPAVLTIDLCEGIH